MLSTLFIDPVYVGAHWYVMLAPLAFGIAVVYKTLKVGHVREVTMESVWLTLTILAGMAAAAGVLFGIYHAFGAVAK